METQRFDFHYILSYRSLGFNYEYGYILHPMEGFKVKKADTIIAIEDKTSSLVWRSLQFWIISIYPLTYGILRKTVKHEIQFAREE